MAETNTPQLLNGTIYQAFWVSWNNNKIVLGKGGMIGRGAIVTYNDPDPYVVKAAGFCTGWGSTGDWQFLSLEGNSFLNFTCLVSF